ncbi:chloride channel protein [Leifsonia poae]|uniref:chloride channel protein n=1 Tax=Leifsonia poae TaxID=110933 RepID=UPI003D6808AB
MSDGATGSTRTFGYGRDFWRLMAFACVLGVFGGAFSLILLGVLHLGEFWYHYSSPGWLGGEWWWIAVTAGAGLLVGLLRALTRLPEKTPGLIADIETAEVEPKLVPGILLVSTASLLGGASLGPEKALGSVGGGAGYWWAKRSRFSADDRAAATLSGMSGAYGGLFSSPLIVVAMMLEVNRPGGERLSKVLVSTVLSSSISFGIYFGVAGSIFVGAYDVPSYTYQDWYLLAGIGMGVLAAIISVVFGLVVRGCMGLFGRLRIPMIVKSVIGGVIFGTIGVLLPLTMFTGTDQLDVILKDGSSLGLGLVALLMVAKMVTMGVGLGTGFVGGPILPALFIGGSAGVALHLAIPAIPLGLAFAGMLASVVGGFVSAPFAMVLFVALTTQLGALNTAPVLLAVITAFLVVQIVIHLRTRRRSPQPA